MIPIAHGDKLTAAELARATRRSTKTVYMWAGRGVLLPDGTRYILPVAGLGHRGEKLYRLADAQRILGAVARRGTNPVRVLAA